MNPHRPMISTVSASSTPPRSAFWATWLVALWILLVVSACGGGRRPPLPEGSALWVSEASAPVTVGELSTLEELGVDHLFGAAGILTWEGQQPRLIERSPLDLPPRTPVTLLIRGSWRGGLDAAATAKELAKEARRVSLEADASGLVATGFHFEVDAAGELASYGRTLDQLRSELPKGLRVSAGLQRAWLDDGDLSHLTGGVDFVVAWLYGQDPPALIRQGWEDEAWDLREVDLSLRRLEDLKTPYLVGVVTLGATLHLDASGRVLDLRPGGLLRPLVRHPALSLDYGFVLTGMDCRRYDFTAEGNFALEGSEGSEPWRLSRGQKVRSLALGPVRVREYRFLLPALEMRHYLGDVFYRWPAAADGLSVGLRGFQEALGGSGEASPEGSGEQSLEVQLEEVRRRGNALTVRALLRNLSSEATEISFVDRNYLEVEAASGRFGRIDQGDFQRYQLLRRGRDGSVRPSLRNANLLRLFEPVLDAGGEVSTGSLEVLGVRSPEGLQMRLNYLLGDGTELIQETAP